MDTKISPLTPFLASPEVVESARLGNADFQGFLTLALKSSGEPLLPTMLEAACYRVVDPRLGLRDNLKLDDIVTVWGQPETIRNLLSVNQKVDRTRIIHSLWTLDTFEEIKLWLKALRVIVRLVPDEDGQLRGHLLLPEAIIPMIETVERKEYVLPNGDMASDAITRNIGIRAKVFALDRMRRAPRQPPSNSIMDRLSRTLSKAKR